MLCTTLSVAQPVVGMTTFFTTTTTALAANTACSITKTVNVSGWLLSISTTSNCGFNWTNSTGGDGRVQYLVGFGTLTQATFGSDNGSEFAMVGLTWGVSTSSWTSKPMSFVGYKNGSAVPGATLNATTPSGTGLTNTLTVTFTNNVAFNDVDDIRVICTSTCNSILFLEDITIGTATSACVSSTVTVSGSSNVLCNGGSTGSATMSASGGSGYTYTWSPSGGNAASATGLSAGTYTCAVTNSCGAITTKTVQITQPTALSTSTAITNALCNGSNGSATVTASGGTGAYSYTWSSGPTTSVEPTLLAGTYTVKVTDANNCTNTKSITVSQPSALVTTTAVTNVLCNGGNGSATVTASGGTGAYSYTWSSGSTTSVQTTLLAGTYTVKVTDANNCSSTKSVTVSQPSSLVTTTAATNALCNGSNGSATVTASGGTGAYSYTWSSGPTTSVEPTLLAGTYTVKVTDANNCTSTKSVTISQPAALSTSTAITNALCNGGSGSATITASGGTGAYSYTWSSGPTASVEPALLAGTYTVKVTDANSCISTKSVTITQPTALSTSTAVTSVLCNGGTGSATLSTSGGTGAYTYSWSTAATTSVVSGLPAGAYTATITDANNCTSTKSVTITQPLALLTSTAVTNVLCNGGSGSATITASGGTGAYTYSWSSSATTSVVSLLAGAYTATVTDANSCTSTNTIVINQPASLSTSTAITNALCNGGSGSATLTASGGTGAYTYSWSSSATTSVVSLLAGAYTATVTDGNGCASIKSVTINQPVALSSNTAVTNALCNGASGSATITASGGTGAYTYSWSTAATTSVVSGLPAGAYTATVTDANGCTSIKSVAITEPASLSTGTAITNALCNGGSGSATLTVSGGTGAYTYSWSTAATTSVVNGLFAGVYTATVSDVNNCISTLSVTITQPAALITSTAVTNALCNGGNGNATITASGGTGAYTYSWSTASTTSVVSLLAGVYTATITDANNCSSTKSVTVAEPSALTTSVATTNALCNGGNGSATITASGGTGAYTYSWSTAATASVSSLLAGTYTATVSDANNCSITESITISEPTALASSTAVTNALCNGGNGSATITASGGTGAYTYSWSTASTTSVVSLLAGVYTATVTDANNCTSTKSVIITQPTSLSTNTAVTNVLCNGGTGSATITASGGTGAYTYSWSSTATTSVVSLSAGVYTATVTDINNCSSTESVTIAEPAALATSTAVTNALCNGSNGSATLTTSGGTGAYTYSWSTAATTSVVSLLAGAYTATITDANNCTNVESVLISQPAALTLSVTSSSTAVCAGSSAVLTATGSGGTGSITYSWSPGPAGNTYTASPAITTTYTINILDANSCAKSETINLVVNALPMLTVNDYTICSGNTTVITPGGASTYTITGGNFTVSPSSTTSYSITGTSVAGCQAASAVVSTVSVNVTPTITVNSATICSGNQAVISPSGASTYSITGNNFTITPSVTTTYSVSGTAANGCVSDVSAIAIVSVNTTPTLAVNSETICSGATVIITPTGASTYSITGNSFTVTPNSTSSYSISGTATNGCVSGTVVSTVSVNITPTLSINSGAICPGNSYTFIPGGADTYTITGGTFTITPSSTNSYTLTGTGANGCPASNTAVATVSVVNTLTVSVSGQTTVCDGSAVTLTANGAATYSWTTGITTNTISLSPLSSTTYTVYGVSGTCSNNAVVSLSVLTTPTITVNSATICSGNSVVITPTGAATYTISGNTFTVSPLADTLYYVTGSSIDGCVSSNTAVSTISVNVSPTLTLNSPVICAGDTAIIIATGADTYTITGANFTVTPAGNTSYSVTGTSTNGCVSQEAIVNVIVNPNPTITISGDTTLCYGETTTLTASGATSYSWSTSATTDTIALNPTSNTTYTVSGLSSGCSNTVTLSLQVNILPTLTVATSAATICTGETASITVSGAATYTWSNTQTGPFITTTPGLAGTETFTVVGTDNNGCANTATINQTADNCTGIEKQSSVQLIYNVYPNPNNGQFVVNTKKNVIITITNSLGEVVFNEKVIEDKTIITINELANGIYFLKATEGNIHHTTKFIKQ